MKDTNHGSQSFREFWPHVGITLVSTTPKMLMAAKLKNVLIPKLLENLGTIVIQFVGKGQNGLENPHHGHTRRSMEPVAMYSPSSLGTTIKAYNKYPRRKKKR